MSQILKNNPSSTDNHVTGHAHQRLFYLHDLPDYKVHEDDPDVRGWAVKLATGETVGTVENLVVDKAARKVRYLEVTDDKAVYSKYTNRGSYLDKDNGRVYDADGDSHFLAPIGMARLDHSDREVYLEGVNFNLIGGIPRYRRGSQLLPQYELETINHYSDSDNEYVTNYDRTRYRDFDSSKFRSLDDNFYTSGYFNDDRYYNRHREASTAKGL